MMSEFEKNISGRIANVTIADSTMTNKVELPDLIPYKPKKWDGAIVISTQPETKTDAEEITTEDSLYIDWAAINRGSVNTVNTFHTRLFLDGSPIKNWYSNPPLKPNKYSRVRDFELDPLPAGNHTLTLEVDYRNEEPESNEENNIFEKEFTVVNVNIPDLTPYQPKNWDSPIVISTEAGTNSDATVITTEDTLYLDWAAINRGSVNTVNTFHTRLLLDGSPIKNWFTKAPLKPNFYIPVRDFELDPLPAGNHTLTLEVDSQNEEPESNEENNVFEKEFTVVPSTLQIPNDTYFDKQWSFHNTGQPTEPYERIGTPDADIDAPEAWNIQTGDGSIVIAVIDTGVDYHHPDLDDNIWTNPGEIADNGIDDDGNGFVDDYYGWDFFYGDPDPDAGRDRGTHLAGIIAAEGNNGIGVAGINWDAQIMPIRVFSNWGTASGLSGVHAVEYATMMGADIIQVTWGLEDSDPSGNLYQQDLYNAIAAAEEAGILVIVALDDYYPYPANYDLDNIITVTSTDENDNVSTTSGSTSDNDDTPKVDLAAPGGTLYSRVYSTLPETFHGPLPEGEYGTISGGTVVAAAHVSGVAALVWAEDPELTAAEVKQVLLESVDPLPELEGITVSGGRLNAYNALVATQAGKIKGSQWHDQDQDGVWDAGEAALENWTIYIDANQNGQLDDNEKFALTDKDGNYSLNLLQPGTHTIAQVSQPGWSQIYPLAQTYEIELAAEEIISGVNFANVLSNPAQIQGNKWHDLDGDGIKDQGESGLAGWTIYLDQNQNGQLDAGEMSTVTDADGNYTFNDLAPGTYTLGEVTQAGWQSTYPNLTPVAFEYVWSDSNQPNGPSFNWIDISGLGTSLYFSDDDRQELVDLPFEFPFYDKTRDFVNISSNGFLTFMVDYEETIVGSSSRASETLENSSTLSASKVYVGQQAPIPHVVPPNGVMAAFWEDLDPHNGDGVYYHYDELANQFIVQYQEVPADIYGSYSGGPYTFEIILSPDGTIVYQYYDLDGDVTEATVGIENEYGNQGIQLAYKEAYLEDELAVKFELVPTAFVYQTVELSPDEIATGVNFGNREIPTGQIAGTKWHDLDGNGIQDSGEVGLAGWTIYLDENANGQLDNGELSTVTDAEGNYSFTGLEAGTYTVAEILGDAQATYPQTSHYEWSDSNDVGGPSFNWIDISAVGTSIDFEHGHDYKEVALPFGFPFYGKAQNSLKISSEGYLTFGSDGTDHTNDEIPNSQQPNDLIAPFWDELDGKTGSIYYYHDQDTEQFIVQYQDILQDIYNNPDRANTFEVILSADGTILYQYDDLNGTLWDVTVGIENSSGTEGINIVHNDPYLEDDLAIKIELVPETPLSHTVSLDSGETVSDINFGNQVDTHFFLDIDGEGQCSAAVDGLLFYGYLSVRNLPDPLPTQLTQQLTDNLIAPNSNTTRTKGTEIADYLESCQEMIDVDGDGNISANIDGLLTYGYLNIQGIGVPALIINLMQELADNLIPEGSGATRTTGAQLTEFLGNHII